MMLSFKATNIARTMKGLKRDRDRLLNSFADEVLDVAKQIHQSTPVRQDGVGVNVVPEMDTTLTTVCLT